MPFNSFQFLVMFLPFVLFLYYLPILKKYQIHILLLSGFVFYACNHYEFLTLLFSSVLVNSITSYFALMENNFFKRKIIVSFGVLLNLFLLGLFKYGGLFYKSFCETNSFGEWLILLPLPIGISFYTFQGISLLIDIFKQKEKLLLYPIEKNFFKCVFHTSFFISFFPHSIAGPIVKAHTFLPQIGRKKFRNVPYLFIFTCLTQGFFLKTVIADNIQNYTFWITYPYFTELSSLTLFFMMYGFSVQIFADFAGYSLIAIGIAALFGYKLPENFDYPYISKSFTEFWKRWHMSLSAWLKEYLYIPLGGNRRGKVRTYINLFLVMLLGGIWHGASWNYLYWGGVHGLLLGVERFLMQNCNIFLKSSTLNSKGGKVFKVFLVFTLVSWTWLFFKLPNYEHAFLYTKCLFFNISKEHNLNVVLWCFLYSIPVFIYHSLYVLKQQYSFEILKRHRIIIYALILFFIVCNGGNSNAFIYFQF